MQGRAVCRMFAARVLLTSLAMTFAVGPAAATEASSTNADWPMWRFDAGRSAASPQILANRLHLQWIREYPPSIPAWEDPLNRDLMPFNRVYEPIVIDSLMIVPVGDRLVALDAATGQERWSYYTGGPIRLPAAGGKGAVFVASDDGYLYSIDIRTASLRWRFRGGPGDRKILGNSRLISTWPARGGPVVDGDDVIFAAGIWPFMGVFIHALNSDTGEVAWTNDSSGSHYMLQPHNSPAYGGIAPQGAIGVTGNRLLVPGGRSVPAVFDRNTGEFLHYALARSGKTGGAFVSAAGGRYINYHRDGVTSMYDVESGDALIPSIGNVPVMTDSVLYCSGDTIKALDLAGIHQVDIERRVRDPVTKEYKLVPAKKWAIDPLWEIEADAKGDLIQAGNRLYAGGTNSVTAVDLADAGTPASIAWRADVEGTVGRLVAAADRLFVVTLEGRIYAFGAQETAVRTHPGTVQHSQKGEGSREASRILEATGVREGYCLAYGLKSGRLVEALARQSDLRIVGVDPDPALVDRLRREFTAAGLYGARISLHVGDAQSFDAAPYVASLTVFEDLQRAGYNAPGFLQAVHETMRPYGGVACFPASEFKRLRSGVEAIDQAHVRKEGPFALVAREGPLPGADDWSHQYGDVANTVKSDDRRVRLPLGVLWFGGSSNEDVLPRHGHGPPEQVVGGRLIIEGMDCLIARDVYTGRTLWQRTFSDMAVTNVYYDSTYFEAPLSTAYNQVHIPGANARGANYVVTADRIYLAREKDCLVLDPQSGETMDTIGLPEVPGETPAWGYIGVYEDLLIAGDGAVRYTDYLDLTPEQKRRAIYNIDITSSKRLVVMNRYTGERVWSYTSVLGLRHNAIVAGGGRIYCIDSVSPKVSDALERRGLTVPGTPALMAFNAETGDNVWRHTEGVFGTWLGYSEGHDALLEAVRRTSDTVFDEDGTGMAVYRAGDGSVLWRDDAMKYGGPCILHGRTIITSLHAYDLLTGEQKMRESPLTGVEEPWAFNRRYGCNYNIASEYLLTFRSASAGYYDLQNDGGTGNFGGFKSGCTSNLVVADGVLNAPDYTRTCACSYQNQTSLALVHMPGVEQWVTYLGESGDGPVRDVGINLGAPGNRRAADGCFWIGHPLLPHVENPEKESGVIIGVDADVEAGGGYYTRHATSVSEGESDDWIVASGCRGLTRMELDLRAPAGSVYSVDLHFAEPDTARPGQRVFDVLIEGRPVFRNVDIRARSGSALTGIVLKAPEIVLNDGKLTLELTPSSNGSSPSATPILSGVRASLRPI